MPYRSSLSSFTVDGSEQDDLEKGPFSTTDNVIRRSNRFSSIYYDTSKDASRRISECPSPTTPSLDAPLIRPEGAYSPLVAQKKSLVDVDGHACEVERESTSSFGTGSNGSMRSSGADMEDSGILGIDNDSRQHSRYSSMAEIPLMYERSASMEDACVLGGEDILREVQARVERT